MVGIAEKNKAQLTMEFRVAVLFCGKKQWPQSPWLFRQDVSLLMAIKYYNC